MEFEFTELEISSFSRNVSNIVKNAGVLFTVSCFYRINEVSVNCVLILIQFFVSKYGVFCVLNI